MAQPRKSIAAVVLVLFLTAIARDDPALAQTTQTNLTATPAAIAMTVLAGHSSDPVSVAVAASQAVPASEKLGVAMLGDLVRDDSAARIPPSSFQPDIERSGNDDTDETFVLTLTPKLAGVDPGRYSGNVRVTGVGVSPLVVPVTVSLQGGSARSVLLLLLFGLLVGWLLKWYTDSGSKLAAVARRYQNFLAKLNSTPSANLPRFLLDEMDDVNQGLGDLDQAKADAALTKLEGQLGDLAVFADAVAQLRDSIQAHADELNNRGLPFGQIVVKERRRLNDALNEATDFADATSRLSKLLAHVNAITACLQDPASAQRTVLDLYNQDRFDEALTAYQTPPAPVAGDGGAGPTAAPTGAGAAAVGVAGGGAGAVTLHRRMGAGQLWQMFLGRILPLLIGTVSVLVLGLVGFRTQWSSNVVFGSGGLSDEVALFLWGVAAFVTGKTVSDFLSKVVSS